ncbi:MULTISPECIES: PucR family transcriptional regulator [unclassified Frankia]
MEKVEEVARPAEITAVDNDAPAGLPGTSLTRLPRAAVLAAADARLHAGLLGDYLDVLASAADSGRRLSAAELDTFRALGRTAAESGAALRALVDLYLSATWRIWPSLPAVRAADRAARELGRASSGPAQPGQPTDAPRSMAEAVGAVSRTRAAASAVLRASDDVVAAVCEGYEAARTARARFEEALRRELVDDLLAGTSEVGQLLERAGTFGLRLEAPHVVVVVAGNRRFLDGRGLTRSAEATLREHCPTDPLVATRNGLLVCLMPEENDLTRFPAGAAANLTSPAGRPAPGARPRGRRRPDLPKTGDAGFSPLPAFALAEGTATAATAAAAVTTMTAVTALARRLQAEPGLVWRLGVSRGRSGVAGVRIGFEEARGAVDIAGRLGLDGHVVHADDLLIYKVLLRDREALAELVDAVLSPLRTARGGAGPLIDTLDAYFTTGGVALAAARRLHLSVRALTYRLDRIHALTRHDPASPTDRYVLQTAVLGARLIGWDPSAD